MSCRSSNTALLLFLLPALAAAASSEEELFFKSVSEVSDGELRFLTQPPAKPVHHHQNRITLDEASLSTGWVRLEQCHQHLDPVPSLQIVFNAERIRGLVILVSDHIDRAWVQDNTVQMEGVRAQAKICIRGESRALSSDGTDRFSLANGPYLRRFLDGYYPMRVSMQVNLATPRLRFEDISPPPQPGFQVNVSADQVSYDAWFEGRLNTLVRFRSLGPE